MKQGIIITSSLHSQQILSVCFTAKSASLEIGYKCVYIESKKKRRGLKHRYIIVVNRR
jgi:hypothetical protein